MIKTIALLYLFLNLTSLVNANEANFNLWLKNFKKLAEEKGISKDTVETVLIDVKFLDKVIVYDNRQPEFFEKTNLYISKRATPRALNKARIKLKENIKIFEKVEKEFSVEKEILLALWSIETNFGNNLGKMDIVSSLATLSFDKRRSEYFTNQLLILLSLVDKKIISKSMLFGSWAGALGNFQFMPSTILNHGIDYDNDGKIDLKKSKYDSIASAANYLNKIGWKYKEGCFYEVKFSKNVKKTFFNHSARNIKNRNTSNFWNTNGLIFKKNNSKIKIPYKTALVLPDGDISSPKYLVLSNYEKILNWNRSLRFALTVCTLAERIKNDS
ncbi:lytic murein transglycosylase [Pelagibacteraceae bacterium]|nr:lytic murein transglycosylase [Pelagibacteraceae bacterium]